MSNQMNKSAKGSMFDGLQIFGKTDSKFSLTNSYHQGSSSDHPFLNSNYEFDVLPLPTQPTSLPNNVHLDEEESPIKTFPMSLNNREMNMSPSNELSPRTSSDNFQALKNASSNESKNNIGLPETWSKPVKTQSVSSEPITTTSQTSSHDRIISSKDSDSESQRLPFNNNFSCYPPLMPDALPEPKQKSDSDQLSYFFANASSEIRKFEIELDKLYSDNQTSSAIMSNELKSSEDFIRASSLISIKKLSKFQSSVQLVNDLKHKIKESIEQSCFEAAEQLQKELEEATEVVHQTQLLQFQPPRQLMSTAKHLKIVKSSRKSHIESMKNVCVRLDELSSKFTSISKKIDVQCSSKIEKQKQEIETSKNMLDCKLKHFNIDKVYLDQQGQSLKDELKVNMQDHALQIQYQDEQLQDVQSEIRDLEERLRTLKLQERGNLTEKQKLITEKVEFEKSHQQKNAELQKERDQIHIKDSILKKEIEKSRERSNEFDQYSCKLGELKNSQNSVNNKLADYKSSACDSISKDEGLIVNEVQVNVNSDAPNLLTIPESLSHVIDIISTHKALINGKSEDLFKFQRELAQIKSDQMTNKSNLEALKELKHEAISRKRFQEASQFVIDEAKIEDTLLENSKHIIDTDERKNKINSELESFENQLQEFEEEAASLQRDFDKECHKTLASNLKETLVDLKGLPSDISTISHSILEYDVCYTHCFLKMIQRRSDDTFSDIPCDEGNLSSFLLEEDSEFIKNLMKKIDSESQSYLKEAVKLKEDIEEALKNEDFKTAEQLNFKYELIADFYGLDNE